ncbi:hypothetical protein GYMLUDRAFT_41580 [Collybiopsis luxurians FD-317 M1]|uniref:Uncharacterized protein n=1 Tax=Collybiopsis luxurians FD-317 M1 TaxID=944289 RepID=A0A0D0BFK8_9AGAR|nr:hypothetical protein GYMLUDRAFT_41580 [Collybiopsis luxurians FD-317 M1]
MLNFQVFLQPALIILIFDIFFYGVHLTILGLYTYLQLQRQGRQRFCQVFIFLLFLFSTAAVVLAIIDFVQLCLLTLNEPGTFFNSYDNIVLALRAIYVAANIIADTLLLYRCYIMWAAKKWVIIVPVIISAINAATAIASVYCEQAFSEVGILLFDVFLGVNLFTNLILTGLIAGRLWWIFHTTQQYLGCDFSNGKKMKNAVAIVLESGLLYPLALIPCIIFQTYPGFTFNDDPVVEPLLTVIVGIAPTLVIVRVDLGISVEANPSTISEAQHQNVHDLEIQPSAWHSHPENSEIPRPLSPPHLQVDQDQKGNVVLTSSQPSHLPQKYRVAESGGHEL